MKMNKIKNQLLERLIKEAAEQYELFKTPSDFYRDQWIKDRHAEMYLFYNAYLNSAKRGNDTLEDIATLAGLSYMDNLVKLLSISSHDFKDIQFAIRLKIHFYFKNEIDKILKAKK